MTQTHLSIFADFMQVDLTLEEKSAAAVLAAGELAAIKAEQEAGMEVNLTEIAVLLALVNKCRPEGTDEVKYEDIEPLEDEEPPLEENPIPV